MAVVTVRNLPPETHRALKVRAARHGRSTEAEIRAILEEAVRPCDRLRVGTALAEFGRDRLSDEFAASRDRSPAAPGEFE